jgi:3-oxoacyl-[acyl-carrier protein] reductase
MFKGKVVIITGAAGGIGQALASRLSEEGARLVLTDIRRKELEKMAEALNLRDVMVLTVEHDVSRPESWEKLMDFVVRTWGRVDILINNAGLVHPGAAWEIPREKVERQVAVNLLGTIFGCQAAVRVMRKQRWGKIVNVASLGGIVPMPGETVYCATKFAIRGYSLSLAAELQGEPISVSAVCPDSVDTPQLAYELLHDEAVMSFIGRPLRPEKAARAILRAAAGDGPELLVPRGTGTVCRLGMAFPKLFFRLFPILRKIGSREIVRRRKEQASKGNVPGFEAKGSR